MRHVPNPKLTNLDATDAVVRAFFALWPDAVARDALTRLSQDVATRSGGKAPAASNVHLTLAFLGEVAPSRIATLLALGAAVAATVPPFRLALDRVGTFRGSGIVWAGASAVPAEMTRLVAELAAALAAGGFVLDPRPFHAHVTLARRCRKRADVSIVTPIVWPVERLVLNASELAPDGPRYRELAGWTLRCAGCGPVVGNSYPTCGSICIDPESRRTDAPDVQQQTETCHDPHCTCRLDACIGDRRLLYDTPHYTR